MTPTLLQFDGLSDTQRAVRDYFQDGGSLAMVLLVLLGIGAVLILTYILNARQRRQEVRTEPADPWKLFHELARKLDLTTEQRRYLDLAATNQGLKHPAVVLISPALFDRYVASPQPLIPGDFSGDSGARDVQIVAAARAVLFPSS